MSQRQVRIRLALGLQSHAGIHGGHGSGLVEFGKLAELAGLDGVLLGDHVVLGNRLDRYPYPPLHFDQTASWMEPLTVLASIAAVTSSVTLSTGVLVSPLRPAVLLAKIAATIDDISGGRLELGVGVGWQPEEFDALGFDFALRGQLLTDGIGACRALWEGSPASYASTTVRFTDIWCEPKPVRSRPIPVLFSGSLHPRNLSRIAELGDGWITHPGQPLHEVATGVGTLRQLFIDHNRDPDSLMVRTRLPIIRTGPSGEPDFRASFEVVPEYERAGVTDLTVWSNSLIDAHKDAASSIAALGEAWRQR
jgi:probable F420-dependent oxidoreductase